MATPIKSDGLVGTYPYTLVCEKLSIAPYEYFPADVAGKLLVAVYQKHVLLVKTDGPETVHLTVIPVKLGAMNLLMQDHLSAVSKSMIQEIFVTGLKEAAKKVGGAPDKTPLDEFLAGMINKTTKGVKEMEAKAVEMPSPLSGYASKTDKPVVLAHATKLHQPVSGTSPGSVYYTVALSNDAKIAVRIAGPNLSFRIEGNKMITKFAEAAGFELKPTAHGALYGSMHLSISDPVVMKKAIGALIYSLGMHFPMVSTCLEDISG